MDLIERQAVIDALYDWSEHSMTDAEAWHIRQVIGDIKSLPPAEPNCSEIPNNSDCISRQAAITAIQKAYADTEGGTDKCAVWKNVGLTNALHIMQDLPSAQPERWIPTSVKPYPNLPEEDMSGYFLVTLHTYGNIGFDMDEYEVKKMRWDRVNGWVVPVHSPAWIEEALTQDVLAWRPCPEPYREGGVK